MGIARPKLLIAGLVIIAFGVAVLLANSAERTQKIADELVEASAVLPENEGRLVLVSGTPELADGGHIVDSEAHLEVSGAIHYARTPLQKVYVLRTRQVVVDEGEDKASSTDDVTETEHYVAAEWIAADQARDEVIERTSARYVNPTPLPLHAYYAGGDLRLSGFKISSADVGDYLTTEPGWFTQGELEQASGDYITRSEIPLKATTSNLGRGMLSSGDEIGDVHVTFSYDVLAGADLVTLVGRQRADTLVLEEDDLVSTAEQVRPGRVGKDEFLSALTQEDASSRTIGIVSVALGALLALGSLGWSELFASRRQGTPKTGRTRR